MDIPGMLSGRHKYQALMGSHIRERFTGWQVGVAASFVLVVLVFVVHISLIIWVYASLKPKDGVGQVHEGDCSQIEQWTQWIHFLINLLGSLMLAASNYCMQRLSAPTRPDIDRAHAAHRWLDIGVPSIRNLRSVSKGHVALWVLLWVSSAPLHLV
jgi:hypothetical protein